MQYLPQLLLVLILVLLNGFFVASEFALVSVRKTRIEELSKKGNFAATLVQKALNDISSFISATQLGITLTSLGLGWVGEPAIAHLIEPNLGFLPENLAYLSANTLSIILAFVLITFLHIVLGELTPKTLALQRSEKIAAFIITPMLLFQKIFWPFIFVLNLSGGLILRLFKLSAPTGHQLVHSEEEIKTILSQSVEEGAIEQGEAEMVKRVFQLADISIDKIIVPRTDIVSLEEKTPLVKVINKIKRNTHSRFPVYSGTIDKIVGFIHIKDIYKSVLKFDKNKPLKETKLVREIIFFPETKLADEALIEMRKRRIQMAVVIDEFGGTTGIVTMEDIIESIVGEIQDEFENPLQEIIRLPDKSYLVDGLTSVDRIQKRFNLPLKGQGYTTLGGLVLGLLGREGRKGDKVQIGSLSLEVEAVRGKRIKTLKLKKVGQKNKYIK